MAQDVRKTLVVLSQIRTALESGLRYIDAVSLALESPNVSGLFSTELLQNVIKKLESGEQLVPALAKLDIFSEYDQTILQAGTDSGNIERVIDTIINQHMFIRSLGV